MKVKEFLRKYELTEKRRFNRDEFCEDMLEELWYMFKNTSKAMHPVPRWEKIISDLKMKWDSVFNKSILSYEAGENLWKYFFATKIIPTREAVFGDWKQAKHEFRYQYDADFRRRYDNWKFHQEFEEKERTWYQNIFNDHINFLKKLLFGVDKYVEVLEIPSGVELTPDVVNMQYRKLSKSCHPDVGGSQEAFIKINRAKDKLMAYLKEN